MSKEFILKYRPFDKVECCFDTVAVFGNNVAVLDNNVEHTFFVKFRPFDKVECSICFDFVERTKFRHCCQNGIVASTLLLLWTGL